MIEENLLLLDGDILKNRILSFPQQLVDKIYESNYLFVPTTSELKDFINNESNLLIDIFTSNSDSMFSSEFMEKIGAHFQEDLINTFEDCVVPNFFDSESDLEEEENDENDENDGIKLPSEDVLDRMPNAADVDWNGNYWC